MVELLRNKIEKPKYYLIQLKIFWKIQVIMMPIKKVVSIDE